MKNLRIRSKLLVGFMSIVLLVVTISGYAIFAIMQSSDNTHLLNTRATSAILSGELESNVEQQRALTRDTALAAPIVWNVTDIFEGNMAMMLEADDEFNALTAELGALLVTEDSKATLREIIDAYQIFRTECDELFTVLKNKASTPEQVVAALDATTPPYYDAIGTIRNLSNFFNERTDEQAVAAANQAKLTVTIMICGIVFSLLVAVFLSVYITRLIANPMHVMRNLLRQAGETGNLMFTDEELRHAREMMVYKDEIAQSLAAFVGLMEHLIYCGKTLETVAARDLTVKVRLLGDKDSIGVSISRMLETLNQMFGEIRTSAGQVSAGSQQIAQASQNLASGSSEQAATIEEVSAATAQIQSMADANAQTAVETLRDVGEAGRLMQACTGDMEQMLAAMRDIDEKSQSISKVIKVIDDIAFQTNILALNAAVEAARAGQHGKGFAVVADEVRNLASKSADAAKETASLIESSSHSVAVGNSIVKKVGESIRAVGAIEEKNLESIHRVNEASHQQSDSMAEISSSILQLSSVVQANSATAEQTAASSEEMSAQATLLSDIIARFKLEPGTPSARIDEQEVPPFKREISSGFSISAGSKY